MPKRKSAAYDAFLDTLTDQLRAASGGGPVEVSQISDHEDLRLRLDVSFWADADVSVETVAGDAPIGPVVANEAEARAALAEAGQAAARHPNVAKELEARIRADASIFFAEAQGGWRGAPLAQTRSVVRKCASCAGAGSFACDACGGTGYKVCSRCSGTGETDEICTVCRGGGRSRGLNIGQIWDDGKFGFRLPSAPGSENAEESTCPACGGAGAVRAKCTACDGAKRVQCAQCLGTGRVTCADCGGAGAQTDRYSPAIRIRYATHLSSDPQLGEAAEAKLRRGVALAARAQRLAPSLVDLSSDALGHRAVLTARLPFSAARVTIGRRSPRVMAEIYAVATPPILVDPPPLIDTLHQRALDQLRMTQRDGPADIADVLSARALGSAALKAAARRDFRFDASSFEPMATPSFAARMFELAKTAHRHVGWRARRWYWPTAALLAPIAVAALEATGASSAISGWTSVAAASSGFDPELAQTRAAEGGALAARVAAILLWWAAALVGAAALYRFSVRRVLGVSRQASIWDALRSGTAPWLGLAGGAALTALLIAAPAPDPELLARAGVVAEQTAAERREELSQISVESADPGPPGSWTLARGGDGVMIARAVAYGAPSLVLSMRCVDGVPVLRLEGADAIPDDAATLSVGLSTNRRALGVAPTRRRGGRLEWPIQRSTVQALRYGAWARIEMLDGARRWPIREFGLAGSADAIRRATAACPGS